MGKIVFKTISIGAQRFDQLREEDCFYIDKTYLIRDWWNSKDVVTLITRPRRFGKTLNMHMMECFFSTRYAKRGDLFEGLSIWEEEMFRQMQGTFPCIFVSFAGVKQNNIKGAKTGIADAINRAYQNHLYLKTSGFLGETEIRKFDYLNNFLADTNPEKVLDEEMTTLSLFQLCAWLHAYHKKPVLIFMDEYDTPLQEAWIGGYWTEIVAFLRTLFNNTYKTNEHLHRAVITGITRVSKESIFSDLNNLRVITTSSDAYTNAFGFTEKEVYSSLEAFGREGLFEDVKRWYDGFCFGGEKDIYNPWSITHFLKNDMFDTYWADSSSNGLVNTLVQQGSPEIKTILENLLSGGTLTISLDEQIVFQQLTSEESAIWSLLLATGYLKAESWNFDRVTGEHEYVLSITNFEVQAMFRRMIRKWFAGGDVCWNDFVRALLRDNLEEMNIYMNIITKETFSSFDVGNRPSEEAQPERFYHGFVLGLLAGEVKRYEVRSNRESGYGRYDIMLVPKMSELPAFVMEFKVQNPAREKSLHETAQAALLQIKTKAYDAELLSRGISPERIRHLGFAFQGKKVLIEEETDS